MLWNGVAPTIIRATLLFGAAYSTYSESKEILSNYFPILLKKDNFLNILTGSIISSFFGCTASIPFDVIKSRI